MSDIDVNNEIIDVTINENIELNVSSNFTNVTINEDLEVNVTNQIIDVSTNGQLEINTASSVTDISIDNNGITIEAPNGAYPFPVLNTWWDYIVRKSASVKTSVSGGYVYELSYTGTAEKRYRFTSNPYTAETDIIYKSYVSGILTEPVAQRLMTL
jgi:hypothetical protein